MPSNPATPRRTSYNRRSAPATPKASDQQPLGAYDANSVQGRIRQWQDQNAAVAAPASGGSDVSQSTTVEDPIVAIIKKATRNTPGKENTTADESTPRRRPKRWVDPVQREWIRQARTSSAPKKRVISDEHWKKTRPAKELASGQNTPRKDTLPATSPGVPSYDQSSAQEDRDARRKRRRELRQSRAPSVAPRCEDDEHEATPRYQRRRSEKGENKMEAEVDSRSNVDDGLARTLEDTLSLTEFAKREDEDELLADQDDGRHRRRSQYADALARPPATVEDTFGSVRSKKGSIFSQAKGIFTKVDIVAPPSQRLPSIEAWLNEQPDPFVDEETQPVEVPKPLRPRSGRRATDTQTIIPEDPDKIWASLENDKDPSLRQSGTSSRRRRRRETLGNTDHDPDVQKEHEEPIVRMPSPDILRMIRGNEATSPGALRRRGAKSSRTRKDSSAQLKYSDINTTSPTSSTLTDPPVEPARDLYQIAREAAPEPVKQCPQTGSHGLSTIASVETFQTQPEQIVDTKPSSDERPSLGRRMTTHEDLLSVLSLPRAGKSIRSARSVRGTRNKPEDISLTDMLQQFTNEESKYLRELRTLVDGVIPVLLKSVLSKSGSAAAAGLFSSSGTARDDLNFTKPIVDMGVALERLKSLHKRAPTDDAQALVGWAQGAHRVYVEYLKAWRLGFQDVVVNLAPADGQTSNDTDLGMERDLDGYVINAEGQKVDVAYLLKRPLVRIKNLSKALNRLETLLPSSRLSQVAKDYAELIALAKRRTNEEQSRLEDEAAANIDATRARDLTTLAVLTGLKIDRSRKVKARDCFNLTLHHSTGQRVDCRLELLLRDNAPEVAVGGDLLLCEIEDSGRWLFFPPVETAMISARLGETPDELVMMLRSSSSYGHHELLALKADSCEAALEWMQMLGSHPLPPKLNRSPSFVSPAQATATALIRAPTDGSRPLILEDIDVPIGEPSVLGVNTDERPRTAPKLSTNETPRSEPRLLAGARPKAGHSPASFESAVPHRKSLPARAKLSLGGELASPSSNSSSKLDDFTSQYDRDTSPNLQRRTAGKRHDGQYESATSSQTSSALSTSLLEARPGTGQRRLSRTDHASRQWMSSPEVAKPVSSEPLLPKPAQIQKTPQRKEPSEIRPERPGYSRALSSTPSKELPTISRVRRPSHSLGPSDKPLADSVRDDVANARDVDKGEERRSESSPEYQNRHHKRRDPALPFTEDVPPPPPHANRPASTSHPLFPTRDPLKPIPPPHGQASSAQLKSSEVPILTPKSQTSASTGKVRQRRSSSPLKHEYAPSTASESASDTDSDDSYSSSSSDTSADPTSERGDAPTPLLAVTAAPSRRQPKSLPPSSFPSRPTTLAPSDSASQGPYRGVPSASRTPHAKVATTIAVVCAWSEKGIWESLHPDECSIVISPGLIEAFEMTAAHSGLRPSNPAERPSSDNNARSSSETTASLADRPLVAFELTPLVPLRRGTALDISIRSPPTERSKIRTSNNVMFRSRNAEECESLYAMINYARINNPTYIALQNARPSYQPNVTFNTGASAKQGQRSNSGSWFGFGSKGNKSSYRASSAPHMKSSGSVGGISESSVTSIGSAFSALRRFSGADNGKGGMFNLNRSSVLKKTGGASGPASLYSSSSGTTGTGSGSASPAPSQMGLQTVKEDTIMKTNGGAAVVNNMKIRLYVRESASKWRDLGAARLTVLPASNNQHTSFAGGDGAFTPTRGDPNALSPLGTPIDPNLPSPMASGQPGPTATGPRLASSQHTPHRVHGNGHEKRILVTSSKSKSKDKEYTGIPNEDGSTTLLDAVLGESCFERIARTGIAVSVWNEDAVIAKEGGVIGGRATTYMLQTKGEAEAGWVFGLVGRLRY